jgi:hypothetical protein
MSFVETPRMTAKVHRPIEIIAKLLQIDALASDGRSIEEALELAGVSGAAYPKWQTEYGGLVRMFGRSLLDQKTRKRRSPMRRNVDYRE